MSLQAFGCHGGVVAPVSLHWLSIGLVEDAVEVLCIELGGQLLHETWKCRAISNDLGLDTSTTGVSAEAWHCLVIMALLVLARGLALLGDYGWCCSRECDMKHTMQPIKKEIQELLRVVLVEALELRREFTDHLLEAARCDLIALA